MIPIADIYGLHAGFSDRRAARRDNALPDFFRVVLDPARLRKVLREFLLRRTFCRQVSIEDDGTGRGRTLIDGEDMAGLHRVIIDTPHTHAQRPFAT